MTFITYFLTFQARDVLSIHETMCPNSEPHNPKLQLSCDGVSESLSTTISLDVYSIKFKDCKHVYPLKVIRPLKKYNLDQNQQLRHVLNDLIDNNCKIMQFVGDSLKRSFVRACLGFNSWYPCEYCFAKGTKLLTNTEENKKKKEAIEMQKQIIAEKLETVTQTRSANSSQVLKLKNIEKKLVLEEKQLKPRKSNICWPKTSASGPPRTREEINNIIDKIENDVPLDIDESKGIVGRSLFLDISGFNFVNDIPVEYLHVCCLGVVKRCVELTFKVGENRIRITKRKLSLPSQFNCQIYYILVPREFNRRIRDLDFSVYKGQEFRNLILFFFPLILNCIEPGEKERNMWLYLTFMIKACVVPTEEFQAIPLDMIEHCSVKFYSLYQALFGVKNCTYNTHIVGAHIIEIRFHGPLTLTSAFPFESFYGELRNSFVPGTPSTLKQIMQNVLMKRVLASHKCENDIYISEKDTSMECNSMIYCFERREYHIYKVVCVSGNILICREQDKHICSFPEAPNLDWNLVGVFKKGVLKNNQIEINRNSVKGKVLIVNDYLITCPNNVLREK